MYRTICKQIPFDLSAHVGKHISDFCPYSLGQLDDRNHCAHFVSHVLGYGFATTTCKTFTFADKKADKGDGAVIRVDDIFNTCATRGGWDDRPLHIDSCLIFVTVVSNVSDNNGLHRMGSNTAKHIGIYVGGNVYHYSNTNNKVACDAEQEFIRKFRRAYNNAGTVVFLFGDS